MQLGLFEENENPEEKQYACQLGKFYIHESVESFTRVINQYVKDKRAVAIDIETSGREPHIERIRTIQVSNDGEVAHILMCEKIGDSCREPIITLFNHCPLILQNCVFDLSFLLVFCGVFPKWLCFDTLIAAQIIDAGLYEAKDKAFGLGSLAKRYLNLIVDKSLQKSFAKEKNNPLSMEAMRYAANDALVTWRLAAVLEAFLEKKRLLRTYRELDLPCCAPSVHIKVAGVPVDKEALKVLKEKYAPLKEALEKQLEKLLSISPEDLHDEEDDDDEEEYLFTFKEIDFKDRSDSTTSSAVNSSQQLLKAFHKLGFKDLESTGESAIGSYFLGKPVRKVKDSEREIIKEKCLAAGLLLEWREFTKGMTYIDGLGTAPDPNLSDQVNKKRYYNPKTGCVHPNLNVCGSLSEDRSAASEGKEISTGRYSCSSPNLQQIPADQIFRDIFSPGKGKVVVKTDASQQEVRILAEVSGDPELRRIYIEAGDNPVDIYIEVAASVLQKLAKDVTPYERKVFKAIVLAVGFAAGAKTVAESAGITIEEAKKAIKAYFKRFPMVEQLINKSEREAKTIGYIANSFSGRRRHWNHEKLRGKEYKYRTQGCNHKIQSGAADCSKKAFLMAYERLSHLGCTPMPPVHDELVFISPEEKGNEALAILNECMVEGSETFMKIVPMKAEGAMGWSWRKEKGFCYICNIEPEKPKDHEGFWPREGFEDVYMRIVDKDYTPCCNRCYIGYKERTSRL